MPCYSAPGFSKEMSIDLQRSIRSSAPIGGWKHDDLISFVTQWTKDHGAGDVPAGWFLCGDFGPACIDCGNVSDALCDFPVGRGKTCDRSICSHCSPEIGANLNYCAAHLDEWERFRRDHLPNVIVDQRFGKPRR